MAVKVITDSTSCIPKDLAEKYGVEIVAFFKRYNEWRKL